jgi:hypothetical protein
MSDSASTSASPPPQRTSDIIDELLLRNGGERLRLGELLSGLHERAFGLAMTLLVLPNCLPMPGIPYVSTLTGVPILILALQLLLGRHEPWLPHRMALWSAPRARLGRFWTRVAPAVRRVENLLRPRLTSLTEPRQERLWAAAIALLALILALPIPFGNLLPGWGILLLALGITERDGHVIIAGLVASVIALCWIAVLVVAGSYLAGQVSTVWQALRAWLAI